MLFAIGYIGAMQAKSGGVMIESVWLMLAGILLGGLLLALALWRPGFVPAVFFSAGLCCTAVEATDGRVVVEEQ
jgi:hypothetical protein